MSRLAIGTVQFGIKYGVNNSTKVAKKEAFNILRFAVEHGIKTVDTAYSYGNSERIIGEFKIKNSVVLEIVTKLPPLIDNPTGYYLNKSLSRLQTNHVFGYLIHDFNFFVKNKKILDVLLTKKYKGTIKKLGFSLYYPSELEYLISNNIYFDIVQFPYNIFDQRFKKYMPLLKEKNIIIHTRSAFLQGAVFLDPSKIEGDLKAIKPKLLKLKNLSISANISVASLCLNFVLENKYIDKVIIGLNSLSILKENLNYLGEHENVLKFVGSLRKLQTNNKKIIIPSLWKR